MGRERLVGPVERYYSDKVEEHGPSPSGVDWNSAESQEVRFEQLLKLHPCDGPFSLNDYGCGYGALAGWLAERYDEFTYRGFDVSESMLA